MEVFVTGLGVRELRNCAAACLMTLALFLCDPPSIVYSQVDTSRPNFELKSDPLAQEGPLAKISNAQDLFKLKSVGAKLEPQVAGSYQDAQASVAKIRQETRTGGGGSSSSGNGNWMAYFQGSEFFGHVSQGQIASHMLARFPNLKANQQDAEFSILFQELNTPQRELSVGVDEDHGFRITLRSSELGYFFRFRQEKSGRIVCQEMSNDFVFAQTATSFDEFSKQNPEYVQQRLMKVFGFIGVEPFATRFSSAVIQQVLMMLRPVDEERMALFRQAIEKMSASSYQVRESATKEIEKNFEKWSDLIQIGMRDDEFAVETRTRLTKIYGENVDKAAKQVMELAQVSKLHLDADYLIWVLGEIEAPQDKKAVSNQLAKLTEQDFGLNEERWNTWQAMKQSRPTKVTGKPRVKKSASESGPIDTAAPYLQQLIRFENVEGELKLDRKHWGKPFGDQPIVDSIENVKEILKEKNLPLDWLSPGGKYSVSSTGYPQVIFENMAARLKSDDKTKTQKQLTYGYVNGGPLVSRNRFFSTSEIAVQMQFHKETSNVQRNVRQLGGGNVNDPPPEKYFYLYFRELSEAKRILEFRESENKTITITLISDKTDTLIRTVQHSASNADVPADSRFVIYDIRGDRTLEFKAANFNELLKTQSAYLSEEWLPLMNKMGIQIEIPELDSK